MEENSYTVMLAKIRAHRATKEVIIASLRPYNVTIMQWLLLGSITSAGGDTTAKKAAFELNVSMPMITKLTKQLETKGMILITPHKDDKRTKVITETKNGKLLMIDSEPVVRQALRDWLSAIPAADVKTYITVLLQVAYKL